MAGFRLVANKLMTMALWAGIGTGVLIAAYSCGDVAMAVEHAVAGR